jgi:glycosyltransferase involved in cell wall biosynthesis
MSVLVHGLRTGSTVYTYRLVQALAEARPRDEFCLLYFGPHGIGTELVRSLTGPNVQAACATPRLPALLPWRRYPRDLIAWLARADVVHVGEFCLPDGRRPGAIVATVHDLTTKLFPQWHRASNRLLHARRLRWVARHATRVIVDAEATRTDLERLLHVSPSRVDVVPLAPGLDAREPVTAGALAAARERYGLGDAPYVLSVGTLEPRKNLARLVQAFGALGAEFSACRLVLAGAWGWRPYALRQALAESSVRDHIILTGAVPELDLRSLYAGATVFVYPSLYEGFGLPVLEAMAADVPVITTRRGALAEVAGAAAITVEPEDVGMLAAAMQQLLRSPDERRRLRTEGRERVAAYSWRRTAELTFEAYERAISDAARRPGRPDRPAGATSVVGP